jgi:hypothetical protein
MSISFVTLDAHVFVYYILVIKMKRRIEAAFSCKVKYLQVCNSVQTSL